MFSHWFLFQLSKLELDSSSITCGFSFFKPSEPLRLLPDAFLLPLISCCDQNMEGRCHSFHHRDQSVQTALPWSNASAEQDPSPLCSTQTQSAPFPSFHKGEVSEEPPRQSTFWHMLRSTKSQHKENYGSPTAFCCLLTIVLFKFITFTLFHNEQIIQ